jgi:hypothetical protein
LESAERIEGSVKNSWRDEMSERRFVIKEVPPTGAPHDFSITETELKRRINMLTSGDYREGDIDILLYGETVPPAKSSKKGTGTQ